MISASLLFTIFRRRSQLFMTKSHHWRTYWRVVQTYSCVYLCKKTIFWTFRLNPNVCLRFCYQKKSSAFFYDFSLISYRLAAKVCIFILCSCWLDWIVQIKFGLRLDIRSNLVDQTEFWTDLEDKTKRLSSLEKFMQTETQTKVWSKN